MTGGVLGETVEKSDPGFDGVDGASERASEHQLDWSDGWTATKTAGTIRFPLDDSE